MDAGLWIAVIIGMMAAIFGVFLAMGFFRKPPR
jgi:hypothetical protein